MKIRKIALIVLTSVLSACVTPPPPSDVNNVCSIFRQHPKWYRDAKDVERRWKVPVPVQMAIIHQESKFNASARPPRTKLMGFIPWNRPSSAYGYTQALDTTWDNYRKTDGWFWASRGNFTDGVDFIGWYANQANIKAGISRSDAYNLYLAYHEGVGGYQRKTYLKKNWLVGVAKKVRARAALYSMQLNSCKGQNKARSWL